MLRTLTIENFFSISEPQTLDLKIAQNVPDPDERFAKPIPSLPDRFPKVVVIFGANGSGKTNLLKAISFLVSFVRHSIDNSPDAIIQLLNFNSTKWWDKPTRFEVEFDAQVNEADDERSRYLYELVISPDGAAVLYEALRHFPEGRKRRLFERKEQETYFSKEFDISKNDPIRERIRRNASVISTLAKFNHPIASAFYLNLEAVVSDVSAGGKFGFSTETATKHYFENGHALESLNNIIRRFDFGIKEIEIEESNGEFQPKFLHDGLDRKMTYYFESQGTQNFYKIFPYLHFVLNFGGVAVLDELGSDIHPLLLPEIISSFQRRETNPFDAQLIMSCHNATLIESLAKEEIYFTEKRLDGHTEIYGLKDVSGVRRDTNIYAKYLAGVFGATPNIG